MAIDRDKLETQKQWDTDPCGAETGAGLQPGSPEFYRAVRKHRYESYAPWMPDAMQWQRWRDRDVLEVGVGLGSDHLSFAQAGARMFALDLSREHLRNTRAHLSSHDFTTRPVYGDAERMPFADAQFDLVYSFGVLHHTPDTARSIAEVHRVLKPGGEALITLYHRNSWFYWVQLLGHNGVLKGGLLRGYRDLIGRIEYRTDPGTAVPLVKVYSRRSAARLFRAFREVSYATHHVEASHFSVLYHALRRVRRDTLERLHGGWYLVIRAVK
jgi:SAM-dependent methyltransferase